MSAKAHQTQIKAGGDSVYILSEIPVKPSGGKRAAIVIPNSEGARQNVVFRNPPITGY